MWATRFKHSGCMLAICVFSPTVAAFNARDARGMTALMFAVKSGSLVNVLMILGFQPQASLQLQDNIGNTALHNAVLGCNVDMVACLISAGAKVDVRNMAGNTPMQLALSMDTPHNAMISLLVSATKVLAGNSQLVSQRSNQHTDVLNAMAALTDVTDLPFVPWRKDEFEEVLQKPHMLGHQLPPRAKDAMGETLEASAKYMEAEPLDKKWEAAESALRKAMALAQTFAPSVIQPRADQAAFIMLDRSPIFFQLVPKDTSSAYSKTDHLDVCNRDILSNAIRPLDEYMLSTRKNPGEPLDVSKAICDVSLDKLTLHNGETRWKISSDSVGHIEANLQTSWRRWFSECYEKVFSKTASQLSHADKMEIINKHVDSEAEGEEESKGQ